MTFDFSIRVTALPLIRSSAWFGHLCCAGLTARGEVISRGGNIKIRSTVPLVLDTALYATGFYFRARATLPWILLNGFTLLLLIFGIGFLHAAASGDFIYFQF